MVKRYGRPLNKNNEREPYVAQAVVQMGVEI